MKNFKWELRKSSKKEICPKCGQRRFVPFVLSSDHSTIAGTAFGRCDREQNCGYFRYPNSEIKIENTQPLIKIKMKKIIMQDTLLDIFTFSRKNKLFVAYKEKFKKLINDEELERAFIKYKIGTTPLFETVYFQIDEKNKIHAAKVINYNEITGHRDKSGLPVRWLHKNATFGNYDGQELYQCFFGQHLINEDTDIVCIFESEKTAVLFNAVNENIVALATGGSGMLDLLLSRYSKLFVNKTVYVFPDEGQKFRWYKITNKYSNIFFVIKDFNYIEKSGEDWCDFVERYITTL